MTSHQEELKRLITENKAPLNILYAKPADSFTNERGRKSLREIKRKSKFYQVESLLQGESYKPLIFLDI